MIPTPAVVDFIEPGPSILIKSHVNQAAGVIIKPSYPICRGRGGSPRRNCRRKSCAQNKLAALFKIGSNENNPWRCATLALPGESPLGGRVYRGGRGRLPALHYQLIKAAPVTSRGGLPPTLPGKLIGNRRNRAQFSRRPISRLASCLLGMPKRESSPFPGLSLSPALHRARTIRPGDGDRGGMREYKVKDGSNGCLIMKA